MRTKIVVSLNLTPDSFSDGGLYLEPAKALKHVEQILKLQPDVIDIGAISTRPKGASSVTVEEELARFNTVLPVIAPILKESNVKISIDSYNFETLEYLVTKLPVAWVNDQSGFADERIIDLVKDTELKLIVMHHITLPVDPTKTIPEDLDASIVVRDWLLKKAEYLLELGIRKEQIILDPGIGFGKTAKQSWQLIKEAKSFANLGYPILYGHSRKSFMNLITDRPFNERDLETSVLSFYLATQGVEYIRIHNAEMNARSLRVAQQIL